MITFKQFLAENKRDEAISQLTILFEYGYYKRVPGTENSYRQDSENTSTRVQRHSHVYAKLNGKGKKLYSVNVSGSGHDGSSGIEISAPHADFFRKKGYGIKSDNFLEKLSLEQLQKEAHLLILFEEM